MVSRKKRMKASDTKLFKELYSVDTEERRVFIVLRSVLGDVQQQQAMSYCLWPQYINRDLLLNMTCFDCSIY